MKQTLNDPSRGRIAAYAWGLDYHNVLAAAAGGNLPTG